jgi:hypothetical protein
LDEPTAILRNLAKSVRLPRPPPSAMFIGMDMAARRICAVRPNVSVRGNALVRRYTSVVR